MTFLDNHQIPVTSGALSADAQKDQSTVDEDPAWVLF